MTDAPFLSPDDQAKLWELMDRQKELALSTSRDRNAVRDEFLKVQAQIAELVK